MNWIHLEVAKLECEWIEKKYKLMEKDNHITANEIRKQFKIERDNYIKDKINSIEKGIKECAGYGDNSYTWTQSDKIESEIVKYFKQKGFTANTGFNRGMSWNFIKVEW